jgi:hypothetical protein
MLTPAFLLENGGKFHPVIAHISLPSAYTEELSVTRCWDLKRTRLRTFLDRLLTGSQSTF